jgi:hypothetical protein
MRFARDWPGSFFLLVVVATAGGPAPSVHAAGTGGAPANSTPAGPSLRQERRSMSLHLHGDVAAAFPLFGPVREAEWAPTWKPRFLVPPGSAQTPDGSVFVTTGKWGDAYWIVTQCDPEQAEIRYVFFRPNVVVGELSVRVTPAGDGACQAQVTYRYTALAEAGNQFIEEWASHFDEQAPHWEASINGRLAELKAHP